MYIVYACIMSSKNNSFFRKTNETLSAEKLNYYIPSHIYFVVIFSGINLK